MFHHRWPSPTSIGNIKPGAHPYTTGKYFGRHEYILIHNGHVENSWELKEEHEKQGIKYRSQKGGSDKFNDSESLLWDFAVSMEKKKKLEAYGSIAFICVRLKDGQLDKLYFGRNLRNPLVMKKDGKSLILSSEGEGEDIKAHTLYTWHYKTHRLTSKSFMVPSLAPYEPDNMCGYDHTHKPTPVPYADDILSEEDLTWFAHKQQSLLGTGSKDNQIVTTPVKIKENLTDEEILEDMEHFRPTGHEINALVMDYLTATWGNFSDAIALMEEHYFLYEGTAETLQDYKDLRLLELAQEAISYDPDWVSDMSISPYFLKPANKEVDFEPQLCT